MSEETLSQTSSLFDDDEEESFPERRTQVLGPELSSVTEQLSSGEDLSADVTVGKWSGLALTETHTVTEREAAENYLAFLAEVRVAAEQDSSEEGAKMLRDVEEFAARTPYLSAARRHEAITGLAAHYVAYLEENAQAHLVLYTDARYAGKSPHLLGREFAEALRAQNPEVADRVAATNLAQPRGLAELQKANAQNTVLLVLDDWLVNASQMGEQIDLLLWILEDHQLDAYKASLELALLVARDDQLAGEHMRNIERRERDHEIQPVPLVAYYRAAASHPYAGPIPTGSHSVADRGFRERVGDMLRYAEARTGRTIALPYLALIPKRQDSSGS